MNLIATINSNREIVAERWAHLWADAGISGTYDSDREIVDLLCREFAKRLDALGIDYEYETRFYFWRGGPGHNGGGRFILRDKADGPMIRVIRGEEYDAVCAAYHEAEAEAMAAVASEIAEILEAAEVEARAPWPLVRVEARRCPPVHPTGEWSSEYLGTAANTLEYDQALAWVAEVEAGRAPDGGDWYGWQFRIVDPETGDVRHVGAMVESMPVGATP